MLKDTNTIKRVFLFLLVFLTNTYAIYDILIISPQAYQTVLNEYMDFKKCKGWDVRLKTCESQWNKSTATSSEIQTLIATEYNDHNIDYAILVGDVGVLPMYVNDLAHTTGDFDYGLITRPYPNYPPDDVPEVLMGRFSVSSTTEFGNMIRKLKNYHFYGKIALISHANSEYEENCQNVANATYIKKIPVFTKVYGSGTYGAKYNADISSAFNNENYGIILYRGHGNEQGYWQWNTNYDCYYTNQISNVTNSSHYPLQLNICCSVGAMHYQSGPCFMEVFTRSTNGPALALGPTAPTGTYANNDLAMLLMDEIYNGSHTTFGDAYRAVLMRQSGNTDHRRIYLWSPDPSIEIVPNGELIPLIQYILK